MANLIKEVRLIKVEMESNNNKFWNGQLFDDGTVKASWGRTGYAGDSGEWSGGESYLDKKVREKTKKGYVEQKTVGAVVTASTTGGSTVKNSDLHSIAKKELLKTSGSPALVALIDRLVKANVHKITSSTNITFNDATGLFQTPLGIVTPEGISEARDILAEIHPLVTRSSNSEKLNRLVMNYLRIVPKHLGMGKFNAATVFPDDSAIQAQSDILDSLEASYQAITAQTPKTTNAKTPEAVFQVDLEEANGSADAGRLTKWFESSKKTQHGYDRVRVKNVFSVKIHDMDKAFLRNESNITEVFHGTSEANCLSILKSGLKTSPPSTAAIAGKMFGNGIYGAINSTKSLGYTYGRWGQGGVGNSGWLFICKFAMGKIYSTQSSCNKPSGYDSVWAKAGYSLANDELIVYKNNQATITHLLECK